MHSLTCEHRAPGGTPTKGARRAGMVCAALAAAAVVMGGRTPDALAQGAQTGVSGGQSLPITLSAPGSDPAELAAFARALIQSAAERWHVDAAQLLAIAECESELRPNARGPDGAAGLFQVAPRTWAHATERLGLRGASPYDPIANTEVAAWLLATAGPGQWGCA